MPIYVEQFCFTVDGARDIFITCIDDKIAFIGTYERSNQHSLKMDILTLNDENTSNRITLQIGDSKRSIEVLLEPILRAKPMPFMSGRTTT